MKTNATSNLPNALIAFGLGAIGGAISVLLARKETREKVLAQGSQSLGYLKEQGQKFREGTEVLMEKGRDLMSGCCATSNTVRGNDPQSEPEDKTEMH